MKCRKHPSMEVLKQKSECALCEDWSAGAGFVGQDQLWQFTTTGWHPKLTAGHRISSMAQWNRLLTRHGLTDDLDLKERIRRRERGVSAKTFREQRARLRERIGQCLRRAADADRQLTTSGR